MKLALVNAAWEGADKCRDCGIRHLVLFADLNQDDFNLIHSPIDDYELDAGETLYQESSQPRFIYTIRSGLVKLVHYLPNGNYRIVRLLKQGDVGGMEALNGTSYLHHAIALENTLVCRIPTAEIVYLNQKSPRLFKQLTARWQKVISDADVWLANLTIGSAKKRVASLLLYLATRSDTQANYSFLLGREDMGALLGITTETASRVTAEFKRDGLIKVNHHYVWIDNKKLEEIISATV